MTTLIHSETNLIAPVQPQGTVPYYNIMKRVSWSAIIAGSLIGLAVQAALTLLGLGIGLASVDPTEIDPNFTEVAIGSPVFLVLAQLIGLAIGGYVAARLSSFPSKSISILHGASVWAVATVAMMVMGFSGVGGVASGATSAVSTAVGGVKNAAAAIIPEDISLPDLSSLESPEFSDLPASVQKTLKKQDYTVNQFKREAREAARNVVSRSEQRKIENTAIQTANDILRSPSDALSDIEEMIDDVVGKGAILSKEDKQQAAMVMRKRFGITQAEAEQAIDKWQARAQELLAETKQAMNAAKEQALETVEEASDALASVAFIAFIASLLGLFVAMGGAIVGRPTVIGE